MACIYAGAQTVFGDMDHRQPELMGKTPSTEQSVDYGVCGDPVHSAKSLV